MAADEIQTLRAELASLRSTIAEMGKMGRVMEVKKGRIRVVYGLGDGGDDGGKDTGTWIRTAHGGAQSEGRQWSKGETVSVWQAGGNPEHAIVHPAGFNDKHPRDGNDTDENSTRRWRKPPEQKEGDSESSGAAQSSAGAGQFSNDDKNDAPQWKDDKDDHQEVMTHDKRSHKFGDYSYEATKDGGTMKYGDTFVRNNKGTIEIGKGSDVHFSYKDGKLQVKCDITDKNGKKFAVQGTKTSKGDALISNFANE